MNRPIFGFLWPPDPENKDSSATQRRLLRIPSRGPIRLALLLLATLFLVMVSGSLILAGLSNLILLIPASFVIATFTLVLLRAWTTGTYVNDDGVVIQHILRADVAPWRDVHTIVTDGKGRLWVILLTGQRFRTDISPRSLDLIGRGEAYAIAVARLNRWFTQE
jgi:hypothetical protein